MIKDQKSSLAAEVRPVANRRSFLVPGSTALLLMDFQAAASELTGAPEEVFERAALVLTLARAAALFVIYVRVAFRDGYPELSQANLGFTRIRERGLLQEGVGTNIVPALQPLDHEVVVTKHRTGPFVGTELDQILRAREITTLVVAGISTSGVVLSTVREAADRDYRLVLIRDCCFDPDPELHGLLFDRVFPRQAQVTTSTELIALLSDN